MTAFIKKKTLKNVRIVCKLFSALATPRLFNAFFIGPSRLTLGIFQNIVSHAEVSRPVRALVYDVVSFAPIHGMADYYRGFRRHCRLKVRKLLAIENKEISSIRELERCIVLLYGSVSRMRNPSETDVCFSDDDTAEAANLMAAGFERWNSERAQQLHFAETGETRSWLTLARNPLSLTWNLAPLLHG